MNGNINGDAQTPIEPEEGLRMLRAAAEVAGMRLPEVVLPDDRFVDVGGLRLHYLDWGGGDDKPVLVFLHGRCQTAHTWDLVCLALRQRFRCLAIDQRGHGDSDWSPDADYGESASHRDLERFADQLGLTKFALIGMSMGGLNSIAYASVQWERLWALALIAVTPAVRVEHVNRFRRGVLGRSGGGAAQAHSREHLLASVKSTAALPDGDVRRWTVLQNTRQTSSGEWTWKHDHRQLQGDLGQFAEARQSLWARVPSIRCPTLVVGGTLDRFFSSPEIEALGRALPHGQWEHIEAAGHVVQEDAPAALAILLGRFLEGHAV